MGPTPSGCADPAEAGPGEAGPAEAGHAEAGHAEAGHAEAVALNPTAPDVSSRRPGRAAVPATALAEVIGATSLLGPRSGTDLANALVRERFARQAGFAPVDLSAYRGTLQFGYSLLSQYVSLPLGARAAQAVATVVGAYLLARLLEGTRRPLLSGLAGAVCMAGDLTAGRTAFALGLTAGLGAVLAVRRGRTVTAALLALLAAALSPVAGLFVLLAAAALLLTRQARPGLALAVAAVVPLLISGLVFGQGGEATMRPVDAWRAGLLAIAVGAASRVPVLRTAAALQVLGLAAALLVLPSVGHNADRLVVLLGVPLVVAYATWRPLVVVGVVAAMVVLRPPLLPADLARAGGAASTAAFSAPVVAELQRLAPTGRVEALPLRDHYEALYVAAVAPLARGWLRQLDTLRDPLFYDGSLNARTYRGFLDDNAVQYVAVADTRLDGAAVAEAALVRGGLPYLHRVWRGGAWTLYAVSAPTPLADRARVVGSTAAELRLRVDVPGDVLVRVAPSRWLTVSAPGCLEPAGDRVRLRAPTAGVYVLGSSLAPPARARC